MNVPIRILGVATLIIWIALAAFIASAAYSIKDLGFSLGEPKIATGPNRTMVVSLPLHISSNGYFTLRELNLTTAFSTVEGSVLSETSTFLPAIPPGKNVTILHNATLDIESLLEKEDTYLFEDGNLTLSLAAALNFAELIPTRLSTNITYPWGAPLHNFALSQPSFDLFSATQARVTVPISFENHAPFDLNGNIRIQLYGTGNSLLGESQTAFNAPANSPCSCKLEFHLPLDSAASTAARSGHFNAFLSTQFFDYGPLVIAYS